MRKKAPRHTTYSSTSCLSLSLSLFLSPRSLLARESERDVRNARERQAPSLSVRLGARWGRREEKRRVYRYGEERNGDGMEKGDTEATRKRENSSVRRSKRTKDAWLVGWLARLFLLVGRRRRFFLSFFRFYSPCSLARSRVGSRAPLYRSLQLATANVCMTKTGEKAIERRRVDGATRQRGSPREGRSQRRLLGRFWNSPTIPLPPEPSENTSAGNSVSRFSKRPTLAFRVASYCTCHVRTLRDYCSNRAGRSQGFVKFQKKQAWSACAIKLPRGFLFKRFNDLLGYRRQENRTGLFRANETGWHETRRV